ncbi:acetyl-CoA carboxylase, carboxyltransferase subunit beta [Streptomyces sp. ICBB 8177]|uniref:acetyl-CoA carboxylase, carboxyltransferase subunit beta n=1 Tax=Streptomyces sp. ICBB 8177 TaxID=563922 RepID=UPI000D67FF09|nr:acetyl-CoA carboxylase, carboxyltransferase subunit beta [Streptomyces sp. ICBB 8177]PWI42953.1 acetyl-CoA carboxylase, carboxyltransferase subunit beta [Streptomyces sp. ICBB 8177]
MDSGNETTTAAVRAAPGRAVPAWVRCDGCETLIYGKRFARGIRVCPECGEHARLTARDRMEYLLDPGSARLLESAGPPHDPLDFTDTKPYADRLAEARDVTDLNEAVLCAHGAIQGQPVVAAVMDFRFLGGSLGCGVGARITDAARTSLRLRVPLLLVTASGGARMQEGALSLMQMAKTAQALADLDEAGILVVSLITDPTYGGVAASFATLADVILAEPGARLGFAGPRVIEQTTRERLPAGFQTAEFLLGHGLVDDVVPRAALRGRLANLLALGRPGTKPEPGRPDRVAPDRPASGRPEPTGAEAGTDPGAERPPGDEALLRRMEDLPRREAWEAVRLARHPDRPTTAQYAEHLLEDFQELHGDRSTADCPALIGGPGRLDGRPVMLIGHDKGGPRLAERQRHHFGMATPAGYRKAARLMRMAAKLGLPVVALIDTPGANPGADAESGGQAVAIAENLRLMSRLPVPIVAAITGEGGSGGALALAVADRVLISVNGIYSVISPEGCAAILWKDAEAAPEAASALRLHARDLLRLGVVDGVVPEPEGGAHEDHTEAAALLGRALTATLGGLVPWDAEQLLRARHERFHRFGLEETPR